jgi:hypothetical protein
MKLEPDETFSVSATKHGRLYYAYPESETFSATGFVLGTTWEGYETILHIREDIDAFDCDGTLQDTLLNGLQSCTLTGTGDFQFQIGALVAIATTTTVSIQGHLFTNVSESIEFIGELTDEQKETLSSLL